MLKTSNLNVYYGDAQVLWNIDMEVNEGEILAVIGSNGAGKSTLLRTISGIGPRHDGKIFFNDQEITSSTPRERVSRGMSHVPEGRRLFSGLPVKDNLLMGAYIRKDKDQIMKDLDRVCDLFPILRERQNQLAGKLSGGEQQMCALARGLMSNPQILLIDELSLGLAPVVVDDLMEILKKIRDQGTTVVVVEQDVQNGLSLADRGYVVEHGRIVLSGSSEELLNNDKVRQAYLGI